MVVNQADEVTIEGTIGESSTQTVPQPQPDEPINPVQEEVVEEPQTSDQQPSGEDVKTEVEQEENRIPHSRVKQMISKESEKAKEEARRELLEEFNKTRKPTQQPEVQYQQQQPTYEQPQAQPDDQSAQAVNYVKNLVKQELEPVRAQTELSHAMQMYPDLPKYKADMITKIKSNPNLSFTDAYKLAKYDSVTTEAKEQGRQEAYQNIQKKQASTVESAQRASVPSNRKQDINVWDKRVPLKDIERQINDMASQF